MLITKAIRTTHFFRFILLFLCVLMPSQRVQAAEVEPIRVLIVDGASNHDWKRTTEVVKTILEAAALEEQPLFDVTVSTCPPKAQQDNWQAWRPVFADYDVVLQNYNNLTNDEDWPDAVKRDLTAYVASGGGLYILHSGNNAFAHWPEYNRMIGLGWRKADQGDAIELTEDGEVVRIPTGQGRDTGHGARVDTVVHTRGEHPITQGYPQKWMTPNLEIYFYARGPAEQLTVLTYAHDGPRAGNTGKYWPIQWTVGYEKGRVYNSTLGHLWHGQHTPPAVRCAAFQTNMVRAAQWLAGREVTFPVPDDFPTAEATSVREWVGHRD